jgi:conjugal transfer/type IV secretion protein DotA/TraY
MRHFRSLPTILTLLCVAGTAHAQATNTYQTTWSALSPGNDWAAQVLWSLFPTSTANTGLPGIGAASTVIGKMVGQLTGYIMAIAVVFVAYSTIMQIHRAAETGRVLSSSTSSWAPVRLIFALAMMFPLSSGFSSGQAAVMQVAMWGIGMGRAVYASAIQAVGPDAVPIAQPMIPGTKTIVAGLLQNELCRALVNAASGNANLVPVPTPIRSSRSGNSAISGAYVSWVYSMSTGDDMGNPVCGSVTLRQPNPNATNIAGTSVDMAAGQQTTLTNVITNDIRPAAESVAQALWSTRQANSLNQLMGTMTSATADYTSQLTQLATTVTANLRSALSSADAARGGNLGLTANQQKLSDLGWTSAGAYYVEIARLNGQTLSLLTAVPSVAPPSYQGLGQSLGNDLAPLVQSALAFQTQLLNYVQTTDGMDAPGGNSELFSGATPGEDGAGAIEQVIRGLHLNERVLNALVTAMSPATGTGWTDPFAALINLGQTLTLTAVAALGLASILASTTATAGAVAWNVLTLNFTAAAASVSGHLVMSFLGTPIFYGLMCMLIPGLLISYVLPMIPFAMWIAGVAGWLILVCEAIIAVPLWMFAHLTFQGDGLHGRGIEGYALLFNVLFRPVLMLFGLFLGYFVFSAMSWLMLQGFGIAAGFALSNGWFVTNLLGVIVLICMFVLMHITLALVCFRLISVVPHQVVKLIGVAPANRVDMDQFGKDVGLVGLGSSLGAIRSGGQAMLSAAAKGSNDNPGGGGGQRLLAGRAGGTPGQDAKASMGNGSDTTLSAQSDISPPSGDKEA